MTLDRWLQLHFAGIPDLRALEDLQGPGLPNAGLGGSPAARLALAPARELVLQACVRVASVAEQPAGFIVIVPTDYDNAEIHGLFVAAEHRGRGIGRSLLDDAEGLWGAQGIDRFAVNASPPMVTFYEQAGFVAHDLVHTRVGASVRLHKDLLSARPLVTLD